MSAVAVAVRSDPRSGDVLTVGVCTVGGTPEAIDTTTATGRARVAELLDGATIICHGARYRIPLLINAGMAEHGVADRAVCTELLAQIGMPGSWAAIGPGAWNAAAAIASLVAAPQWLPPAGPLGVPAHDVAALAAVTAAVFAPAYAAAASKLSPELVRRDQERMRSGVRAGIRHQNPWGDGYGPVTMSESTPVPAPVRVQVSPLTCEPEPVREKPSMIAGIQPEIALYAPVRKVAAVAPTVVALAAEHDIDVAGLTGTGVGGRVIMRDVRAAIKGRDT